MFPCLCLVWGGTGGPRGLHPGSSVYLVLPLRAGSGPQGLSLAGTALCHCAVPQLIVGFSLFTCVAPEVRGPLWGLSSLFLLCEPGVGD